MSSNVSPMSAAVIAYAASKTPSNLARGLIDRFIDDDADQAKTVKAYGPGCSLSCKTQDGVKVITLSKGTNGQEVASLAFAEGLQPADVAAFFEQFAELAGPRAPAFVIGKLPPVPAPAAAPESSLG